MKLAIVGSRSFSDPVLMSTALHDFFREKPDLIISGKAPGADMMAERWAAAHGISTMTLPADWAGKGKAAGFARNVDIVRNCDKLIAFWDGKSRGTAHTLNLAKMLKKPTVVVYF